MLETLSLLVWSLLQVLKKAKRANCVFALTDGLTSLEIVSFCGLKIRPCFCYPGHRTEATSSRLNFSGVRKVAIILLHANV